MSFSNDSISISDTPVLIITSNTSRINLSLSNTGSDTVYIGSDNSITGSDAYPIYSGEEFVCNDYTGTIYGVTDAAGSGTINYFEEDL